MCGTVLTLEHAVDPAWVGVLYPTDGAKGSDEVEDLEVSRT